MIFILTVVSILVVSGVIVGLVLGLRKRKYKPHFLLLLLNNNKTLTKFQIKL